MFFLWTIIFWKLWHGGVLKQKMQAEKKSKQYLATYSKKQNKNTLGRCIIK